MIVVALYLPLVPKIMKIPSKWNNQYAINMFHGHGLWIESKAWTTKNEQSWFYESKLRLHRLDWFLVFFLFMRIVIFVCKIEFKAKSQELLAKNNSFNIFTWISENAMKCVIIRYLVVGIWMRWRIKIWSLWVWMVQCFNLIVVQKKKPWSF